LFDLNAVFFVPTRAFAHGGARRSASRLAVAPIFPHSPPLPGYTLTRSEHDGTLDATGMTIRGELAIGRGSSRHNLVFGKSIGT